jgi:hypothetical protein
MSNDTESGASAPTNITIVIKVTVSDQLLRLAVEALLKKLSPLV